MVIHKIIAYLRLSRDDGDSESSSITNQRRIIQEYADRNGLTIDEFIVDDGYSGFTLDRPGFNKIRKMLNDGVQCTIIAKDLSRVGRHGAKVQLFIEKAEEIGSRVITLAENLDTDIEESQEYVGVHTWINEKMVRDTSRKIRKSIAALRKEGKLAYDVPYGYVKDDNDKYAYHIDETVAPYIKLIYDLYIDGNGIKKVAKILTDRNIPTPSMVRKIRAEQKGKTYKRKVSARWDEAVVNGILRNDFYIGTLTLNKTTRKTINGKPVRQPKENRYTFPNSHPPIIDRATWQLVQNICDKRREKEFRGTRTVRSNIFAGTLICADCGRRLTSASGRDGNTRYICRTYNTHGTSKCTSHAVSEKELTYVLIDFLEYCRDNLIEIINDLSKIIEAEIHYNTNPENNIKKIHSLLQDTKKSVGILMEQKIREIKKNPTIIDTIDKIYDEMLNEKYKEIQVLEKQIEDQQQISTNEIEMKKNLNSALSLINSIIESRQLTKKQVLLLVDEIIVHEDTSIDFKLKGDLHKVCQGYFKVSGSKLSIIKRQMYEYIIKNPNRFTTPDCTVYVRNTGTSLTIKTVSKIMNEELKASGIIEYDHKSYGYKLVGTEEELKCALIPNINMGISRSLHHNNDIIGAVLKICEWIKSMEYRKNMF